MAQKINIQELHENEVKLILALRSTKKASIEEIAAASGLPKDAAERASDWARTKGLVSIEEHVSEHLILSDEGKEYAETMLPEKTLLGLVGKEGSPVTKLKESFEKFDIALVWGLRNRWLEIDQGIIHPTAEGIEALNSETTDEKILRSLRESQRKPFSDIDAYRAEILLRRGLIKKTAEKDKTVHITALGEELLPLIDSRTHEAAITQLTPELIRTGHWKGAEFQRYDVTLPYHGYTREKGISCSR